MGLVQGLDLSDPATQGAIAASATAANPILGAGVAAAFGVADAYGAVKDAIGDLFSSKTKCSGSPEFCACMQTTGGPTDIDGFKRCLAAEVARVQGPSASPFAGAIASLDRARALAKAQQAVDTIIAAANAAKKPDYTQAAALIAQRSVAGAPSFGPQASIAAAPKAPVVDASARPRAEELTTSGMGTKIAIAAGVVGALAAGGVIVWKKTRKGKR